MTQRNWMFTIWVIVMIVVMISIGVRSSSVDERIVINQVASCERVNALRTQSNNTTIALHEFLEIAERARREAAAAATTSEEQEFNEYAADSYAQLRDELEIVPIVDCEESFQASQSVEPIPLDKAEGDVAKAQQGQMKVLLNIIE